jgi:phosphatidylserine/phosphatidylglycerophosphate/cardiolipin synthase-like enzyme
MPRPLIVTALNPKALRLRAYHGDGAVLLAMDLDEADAKNLAGFAIQYRGADGKTHPLSNRLSFESQDPSKMTATTRKWYPSDQAPFQKFWWADFPRSEPGQRTYEVTAMYRGDTRGKLIRGDSATVTVNVGPYVAGDLTVAFTKGYISSQAYADRFKNKDFRPKTRSIDFDTKPFQDQYEWLGANARRVLYKFLDEALAAGSRLDVFAYDLDEPDVIRKLAQFGSKLRLFLDNAALHTKETAMEPKAFKLLSQAAGSKNAVRDHFQRFAHCKVLIQRDPATGRALRVLTGSANFSLRGLYVQANSVIVFNDAAVAQSYADAFDIAFGAAAAKRNAAGPFKKSASAATWHAFGGNDRLPVTKVSFAPHADSAVSMEEVADAIANAKSSVLFAIMELQGSGPVLEAIRTLARREDIFTYGVTQSAQGLNLYKPDLSHARGIPFALLDKFVPPPFTKEWRGGSGQIVHHKFIIVDFNGAKPVAFAGSSNLAALAETQNGDNLIEFADPGVAQVYGIEAIRLVDHYHFREAVGRAKKAGTLELSWDDSWWKPYYQANDIHQRSRELFATGAEP